ncbi:hypothetical protein DTO021C3_397 [Paecilomyces variotii]|nr:hypothetical protein DTO021C3_397 [Paecilomyces variotii]KAJ9396143.1 hypothetical protein DTO282F9_6986 [Paecilomyces variotii]
MSTTDRYIIRKTGQPFTSGYRVYIEKDNEIISPWHDIPLYNDEEKGILNMIVEIPRWSNAKMEISKDEFLSPIKQDIKKGRPRYVPNIFPHKGYPWNYGAFPQTWEDPSIQDPHTHANGDNDPLDVCELGGYVGETGEVKPVKVLGAFAILDEGETDWKVLVVDVRDALAAKVNDIGDVEAYMPGFLEMMKWWFRMYKVPDGKKENELASEGNIFGRDFAMDLIRDCHKSWKAMMNEERPEHTSSSLSDLGIRGSEILGQTYNEKEADPDKTAIDKSYFFPASLTRVPDGRGTTSIVEIPAPAPMPVQT